MGIDYGMGKTNIDTESGIRYGVIPIHDVLQAWSEESDADYGKPHCPQCYSEAITIDDERVPDLDSPPLDWTDRGRDYACLDCKRSFWADAAFPNEPGRYSLDDGEYQATQASDAYDIFVIRSPYYTFAPFCSPCAPGACYLRNGGDTGDAKAYCFGHDWFDGGKAPYPVYRVSDDTLVNP